jgi:hypothetical protein
MRRRRRPALLLAPNPRDDDDDDPPLPHTKTIIGIVAFFESFGMNKIK